MLSPTNLGLLGVTSKGEVLFYLLIFVRENHLLD